MLKKSYLIFAFLFILGIALLYGVSPQWFAKTFFGIEQIDRNFAHILRAVMGLYVGFGLFWLTAAFNKQHQGVALLTVMVLAGGLLAGRLISLAVDGMPSSLLQFYTAVEFVIVAVTWWVYRLPDA